MPQQKEISTCFPLPGSIVESVRFNTQKLQHPELSGRKYQQKKRFSYEIREYSPEKWKGTFAYCGAKDPLEVRHIDPKSRKKSAGYPFFGWPVMHAKTVQNNRPLEAFLSDKPELLKEIKATAKAPLCNADFESST
ncbi:MAG: hypothetical protein J5803_02150 [Desulfovibrio sp.]|nr:hypothetical protein [Desulfovibrio sp.]